MTKFKFGDKVYFPSNVEEIGVVIELLQEKIIVAWNDGTQTKERVDDEQLTIIPNPHAELIDDTVATIVYKMQEVQERLRQEPENQYIESFLSGLEIGYFALLREAHANGLNINSDTARLNWLVNVKSIEVELDDESCAVKLCNLGNYRQYIDRAMQQEQENDSA